jgi:YD repeat-containing protein
MLSAVTKASVGGRHCCLGRTTKAEAGTIVSGTSTTLTQTDTVYDSCGCSPLGKLKQTSLPHAPGAGAVWTTYTYDGIGRTLSMQLPDGASTTTYSYQGNTVTVTDPAGAWPLRRAADIATRNQAVFLLGHRLMASLTAIELEKNSSARKQKLAEHGALLKELQTKVQAQSNMMEMMQHMMAAGMMDGKMMNEKKPMGDDHK